MREQQPDGTYAKPADMPVVNMFPELFAAGASGWLVMISVEAQPVGALVSLDVARAAFEVAGQSGVAGDLPSSISWPDLCAEALVRRVVYLTDGGRIAAAVVPYDIALDGQRYLRDSTSGAE
jgi:hypothetical protein